LLVVNQQIELLLITMSAPPIVAGVVPSSYQVPPIASTPSPRPGVGQENEPGASLFTSSKRMTLTSSKSWKPVVSVEVPSYL
jgi:hypothetical protein